MTTTVHWSFPTLYFPLSFGVKHHVLYQISSQSPGNRCEWLHRYLDCKVLIDRGYSVVGTVRSVPKGTVMKQQFGDKLNLPLLVTSGCVDGYFFKPFQAAHQENCHR